MSNQDKVICPFCREWCTRTLVGQQGTNIIYLDDTGRRWCGRRCPDCAISYKLEYDAKRRKKLGHVKIGSEVKCSAPSCSNMILVKRGSHRMCESCRKKDTE